VPLGRFLLLAAAALLVRVLVAPWAAHGGDMGTFIAWAKSLADGGFTGFYERVEWCDYLPGYLYVLRGLGEVVAALDVTWRVPLPWRVVSPLVPAGGGQLVLDWQWLLFKTPSILADLGTAYLLWRAIAPSRDRLRLWVPALYLFNPAILSNAALWGQVDSFHTFFIVAGVLLTVGRRLEWAAVLLGLAVAIKPHAIVLLPAILVWAIAARCRWQRIVLAIVLCTATFAGTFIPFAGGSLTGLWELIYSRVTATTGQYNYATVNAFNLWYLLGLNWKPDATLLFGIISVRHLGMTLVGATVIFASVGMVWRRPGSADALWKAGAIIFLGLFLFVTKAHERHLFPFFAFMLVAAALHRRGVTVYAILSVTYCINVALAWRYLLIEYRSVDLCHPMLAAAICIVNLLMLPVLVIALTDVGRGWRRRVADGIDARVGRWTFGRAQRAIILGLIMLFALVTRVGRLNQPPERYFDEVYHAYTAEQWAEGNTDPWRWDTRAPDDGCAYEWTHPPLAKLIMSWSIRLFGDAPWAWRLPSALLGALLPLLVYLIGRRLFERDWIALLAAAFAALDTLPLFSARIGMNDMYCVTLILAAVLAALHRRYYLSATAIGLALACKWTALYGMPLLLIIHIVRMNETERAALARLVPWIVVVVFGVPAALLTGWLAVGRTGLIVERVAEEFLAVQRGLLLLYGLLVGAIVVAFHLRRRDVWVHRGLVSYLVVVPACYLATYIPFFQAGNKPVDLAMLHYQMWYYHTQQPLEHPFASSAWQWPLGGGAIWCYTDKRGNAADDAAAFTVRSDDDDGDDAVDAVSATSSADDAPPATSVGDDGTALNETEDDSTTPATRVSNVWAVGNPLIWLPGAGAVLFSAYQLVRRREFAVLIPLVGYALFWVPWLLSPRIMFIYHYLPPLPFMYLLLAWCLASVGARRSTLLLCLVSCVAAFAIMYPYVTAVEMPAALSPTQWRWIWQT